MLFESALSHGRSSHHIQAEIETQFGFMPPFFEPALPNPAILESLWQQTQVAYLYNPLPALFKDKLFAYLSRYCAVPYCLVCHTCALGLLGIPADQILELLLTPASCLEQQLSTDLTQFAVQPQPLEQFPELNSDLEQGLFRCAVLIFLKPQQSEPVRQQLGRSLGETGYAHLANFLAYVSHCHHWVEAHPELEPGRDRRVQHHLTRLLTEAPDLANFFQNYPEILRQEQQQREDQLAIEIAERQRVEAALRQSEEQLRSILQNMPVMLDAFDSVGNIVVWNQECERVTGYSATEILNNPQALEMLYPDANYRQQMLVNWQERGNRYRNWEWGLTAKDGTVKTVAWSNISDDFPVPGWFSWGIGVDVSDRQRAEQAIRKLNQTLEQQNRNLEALVEQRTAELLTFINSLPDHIFVVDRPDFRVLFCNDVLAQAAHAENRHAIEGKTIFECFPENAAYFVEQNRRVFETGETLHVQETLEFPSGVLHLDTYKIPLKRPTGEVYALIGTSRNITELVHARQALVSRTLQLEAINQELESFSYSVSHDLRAPLRHITGFVTALAHQLERHSIQDDPKITHYLEVIQTSSQRMGQLIDGLLTLSRVGRRQLLAQSVDLNQLVQAAIALVQQQSAIAPDKSVEFIIGDLPAVIGDSSLLQQVFSNLIDNAVKFSRSRRPARIEINTLPDGTIFVRDNGVGFQMEYADQLFGAFQRLHSQAEFPGAGIGLAIVQRIIHRHSSKIWAESQPNQGACFYFKLREIDGIRNGSNATP